MFNISTFYMLKPLNYYEMNPQGSLEKKELKQKFYVSSYFLVFLYCRTQSNLLLVLDILQRLYIIVIPSFFLKNPMKRLYRRIVYGCTFPRHRNLYLTVFADSFVFVRCVLETLVTVNDGSLHIFFCYPQAFVEVPVIALSIYSLTIT